MKNFKQACFGAATMVVMATGTVATLCATDFALNAAPTHAATLAAGEFTLTGASVSEVTGFTNANVGSTFTLNLDKQPLTISDTQGVFAGISGLTGLPNLGTLLLTVVTPGSAFSFASKPSFITGLKQNGEDIFFDLDAGSLFGFITTPTNYSFGGTVTGKLRDSSGNIVGALGSIASFNIGSGLNSNRSSITVTTIPTPALLPGLIALGAGVLRKRKSQEVVEA